MCVYACLFLVSAHYWAPTVLSPDGKPFDRKLIKVLLGLPTVNVLIIVFLYEDKLLVHLGAKKCYHRFCTFYMPAETVGKMGICWKQHVFFLMITPPHPLQKKKKKPSPLHFLLIYTLNCFRSNLLSCFCFPVVCCMGSLCEDLYDALWPTWKNPVECSKAL